MRQQAVGLQEELDAIGDVPALRDLHIAFTATIADLQKTHRAFVKARLSEPPHG